MELLVNDLSVHEQFHDLTEFRDALSRLMVLRETARHFGHEVQCHRAFCNTKPIPDMPLPLVIGKLHREQSRAVMSWLSRSGPFWDDVRRHSEDDWLECNDEVVTDTAIGEAAFKSLHGVKCGLVSLTPSRWCRSPLDVTWVREAKRLDKRNNAKVENWWCAKTLEESLRHHTPPFRSWDDLCEASSSRFASLVFAEDCFTPLAGVPFARSAADRLMSLLDVLDRFARAFDDDGKRNAEGHHIYQDYFTGTHALFSDSSDDEKHRFRQELTFAHPEGPLFCPWHAKVRHLTLRLHFSWPEAGKPIHVVYAGPKITKR